ncbi:HlyD family efflux transporter periplasmic adaptor subunit [Roseburia sp. 831b]|uniref:HlyD family efflux transporter periplasmic adaptor subunit n=1 Tax=Roseburia sp. 831b TaxID=1261635 RepID=UPI0009F96D6F|nr:HlyD family efflux transporter periplasmic adaptor subunit [Roseburia sp. 831b]WVK74534.1 HlyD family efflux transporter periplasmic adaptor subunit [Roseburia sp. 831b]
MKHSKKFWVEISGTMVVVIVGGTIGFTMIHAKGTEKESAYQETSLQYGDLELAFEEDGTTAISTDSQLPEFSVTAVTMTVEEVYVESGDSVNEGDALYKLTDDSVEAAKEYYEEAVADAKDDLDTAEMNYETGVLEVQYTYQSTLTDAENADASYSASLSALDATVAEKKAEWENAKNDIATYTNNLANNTYYTEAGVEEKEAAVTSATDAATAAQTAYQEQKEAYDTAKTTLTNDLAALQNLITSADNLETSRDDITTLMEQVSQDYGAVEAADESMSQAKQNAEKAQSDLQAAQKEAESAKQQAEQAAQQATKKKEELESKLSQLESDYQQALRDAVTKQVSIENEYDSTVLEAQYADSTYDATITTLQDAVDSAQSTLDDLEEEQNALLSLEDGVVCASQDGTIASVTYDADDTLVEQQAFVSYYNTQTISISVEVSQEDISKIAVGDTVSVAISGARTGNVEGKVASIASSATTGGSVSNVTYAVGIQIDNSDGMLSSGSSANVTFSYGTVEDVYYIETDALSDIDGTTAKVKQYDENGDVVEIPVTIGESTEQYTVVVEGISADDTCLIETEE